MAKDIDYERSPNPIDRHVGLRIRMRRKELGVSQERLAEQIGLTFQQVQKYERAANRVSASKLWEMARALKTSIDYFYEGLGDPAAEITQSTEALSVHDFLMTPEGMELAASFPKVRNPRLRDMIFRLDDQAGAVRRLTLALPHAREEALLILDQGLAAFRNGDVEGAAAFALRFIDGAERHFRTIAADIPEFQATDG